jgi:hypothetical protein
VHLYLKYDMQEQKRCIVTYRPFLVRSIIIGWCIGLVIISFFVFGVDIPSEQWGRHWQVRPLLVTPIASSVGALACSFFAFISKARLAKSFGHHNGGYNFSCINLDGRTTETRRYNVALGFCACTSAQYLFTK